MKNEITSYDKHRIAKELTETALGNAYHGNALRVAKDTLVLTSEERWVIQRWLSGSECKNDYIELQHIANRIIADT